MITSIAIIIIIIYLLMVGLLVYGFDRVDDFKLQDLKSKTKFSVVIPFRDEADNLEELLNSILKLNYPKALFEVILVDDDSSDNSVEIINNIISKRPLDCSKGDLMIIKNRRVSNSPKKDAINTAITISKHEWIITTDADCVLPTYWLNVFDEFIQTQNPNCIVAPVAYSCNSSFFNHFQALDFLSLQGATIGGFGINKPFLCSGANFGYRKSIFKSLNGFVGNNNIASGDDIFLLEKFNTLNSKKVAYLKAKNAIVFTKPVLNFKELIQQRLRWASKTSKNPNWFSKLVGFIILFGNLVCLEFFPSVFSGRISMRVALTLVTIKICIDFLLVFKTVRFFKQEGLLWSYLLSSIIYPFFSVFMAILSFFTSYNWKGRRFKK